MAVDIHGHSNNTLIAHLPYSSSEHTFLSLSASYSDHGPLSADYSQLSYRFISLDDYMGACLAGRWRANFSVGLSNPCTVSSDSLSRAITV